MGLSMRVLIVAAALSAAAPAAWAQAAPPTLTLYDQPDYGGGSVTFYGDHANIGSTGIANRARSAQIRGSWRLCEGGGYRNRCVVLNGNVRDLSAYDLAGRVGSAQRVAPRPSAAAPPQARYQPPPQSPAPAREPYRAPPGAYRSAPYPEPADAYARDVVRPVDPYREPAQPYARDQDRDPAYAEPVDRTPYTQPDDRQYAPPARDYAAAPAADAGGPYDYEEPDYAQTEAPPFAEGAPASGQTTVFFAAPSMRGSPVSAARPGAAAGFCRSQGLGGVAYSDGSRRAPRSIDIDGRMVGEGPVLSDVLCRRD